MKRVMQSQKLRWLNWCNSKMIKDICWKWPLWLGNEQFITGYCWRIFQYVSMERLMTNLVTLLCDRSLLQRVSQKASKVNKYVFQKNASLGFPEKGSELLSFETQNGTKSLGKKLDLKRRKWRKCATSAHFCRFANKHLRSGFTWKSI